MLKISTFFFNTSVDSHESSMSFNCCNVYLASVVIKLNQVYEGKVV